MRVNRNNNQEIVPPQHISRTFHSLSAIRIKKDMFILNHIPPRAHSIHHLNTSSKPAITRKLTYISTYKPKNNQHNSYNQANTSSLTVRTSKPNQLIQNSMKIITSARQCYGTQNRKPLILNTSKQSKQKQAMKPEQLRNVIKSLRQQNKQKLVLKR